MIKESKLPPYVTYNQIANTNDDEFLFCLIFPKFEYDFWCGLSLKKGVLLIGFIFVLCGVSTLFSVLQTNNNFNFYSSVILLSVYTFNFILLIISSINNSFVVAYLSYLIYCGILILNLVEVVVVTILILIGFYSPNGIENAIVKGVSFFLIGIMLSCVYIYCLWIIFSYAMHLKYERQNLVSGEYEEKINRSDEENYKLLKENLN